MIGRIYKLFLNKLGLSQYQASYLTIVAGIILGISGGGIAGAVMGMMMNHEGFILNGSAVGAILGCLASYVKLLNVQ